MLIIPQVLTSVVALGEETPSLLTKVTDKLSKWNADRSWAGRFQKYIDAALDSIENWITNTIVPKATTAVISLTSAAWSVLMFIVNFLIGIVIAVYVLKEKRQFISWGKKLSYALFKPETANMLIDTARHGNKIFQGYLIGSLIDSAVVGVICFIFNSIAHIPYPLLIATIIGITNVIPFFGPILGAVPSGFIILLISPFKALIFIVFVIVLNQIEGNIIAPKILGSTTGISEFWVTFALLFFGAMFGVFGMVMGVPILAVLSYVLSNLINKHMEKKKLAIDAEYYFEVDKYDSDKDEFVMIDQERLEKEKHGKVKPKSQRYERLIDCFKERSSKSKKK
jgi:predicted PurR-regulated permease PerM